MSESTETSGPQGEDDPAFYRRSYELVGEYMSVFAGLETMIDLAIKEGLALTLTQSTLICSNMAIRNKVAVIKVLVNGALHAPDAADAVNTLNRILNEALPDRNMVAHTSFFPEDREDRIRFYKIEAKSRFGLPDVIWTEETFEEKFWVLEQLSHAIGKITEMLTSARANAKPHGSAPPTQPPALLALLGYPSPLAPDLLGSDAHPATPEKDE